MNIIEIAEIISAFATFLTVCLAVIELVSRRRLKNAEEAIEAYANYLIAEQQISYLVCSAFALIEKCDKTKYQEYKSYATSHMPDSSLVFLIQSVEKESITTFDSNKASGKSKSKVILDAAGAASDVVAAVRTLYQTILDHDEYPSEAIYDACELIKTSSAKLDSLNSKAEKVLNQNLKDINKSSKSYIISLVCISLFFFCVCVILGLL